ncbi:GNAT family N-acetyltransferase [Methylocystis sp. Sn-Cys]|uniref:GNAT family N-acetyltransferase n=1 Tax=Methylocystis sp. Sn-Cys TaxID=1701263 RepID=UPI001921452A|nr:GNAT family N-acetyltransferase [Methylocystis sp. Sn-Cys]MBL1257420.1 GNAT family N-acetyltransferase [Methylocystis sp. Sn-Cys]
MTIVRDIRASDAKDWRRLWAGYNDFYESTVPADVTEHTLRRLLDPNLPLIGRIAETDGQIAGFTISVLHDSTWTMTPSCYLEDLFVDPGLRGGGVGQALIQDLIDLGRAQGWSRIYWHTKTDNARARRLYDKFVGADDFVRYRLTL